MAYSKKRNADAGPDEVKALREALAADALAPLYVFHGEETYLRDHYLAEMKKHLCGDLPELNCEIFEGKACTPDLLRDAVLAFPAFGGRRLVIVRDYDILRAPAAMAELARELFPDIPETTTLVFVYYTVEYRIPGEKDKELFQLISKHGRIVEFRRAEQPALEKWISNHFRAMGKSCDRAEASYLIARCGGLMAELLPEIEKIGHFAPGERITTTDIDAVSTPSVESRVFSLTDAVIAGDRPGALRELFKLAANREEPIVILGAVAKQMRQLYAVCVAQAAGEGEDTLAKLADIRHSFVLDKMRRAARYTDISRARAAVCACAETDLALKSSGGDRWQLMEQLVYRLTGEAE